MARAIEDRHVHVFGLHPLGLGDQPHVLFGRRGHVDGAGGLGARRDLLHVHRGAGEEHRASLGERDHGDRVRLADGGEGRAVDRVDRHVDAGPVAVADLLAVEEHGRLVLLALADHDRAVHRDRVDHEPHRVDGGGVGGDLVAVADPAAGGQRRGLGHAGELHRQVAVGAALGHGFLLVRRGLGRRGPCRLAGRGQRAHPSGGGASPRSAYQASVRRIVVATGVYDEPELALGERGVEAVSVQQRAHGLGADAAVATEHARGEAGDAPPAPRATARGANHDPAGGARWPRAAWSTAVRSSNEAPLTR